MIQRVGHIKISFRVQRDAPRVVELPRLAARPADDLNGFARIIEHLNARIAELADEHIARSVHLHIVGIAEFARPASWAPNSPHPDPLPNGEREFAAGAAGISIHGGYPQDGLNTQR